MPESETFYQVAQQEVLSLEAMLVEQAALFDSTFALSADEIDHLHAHAELHATGGAIEFFMPEMDIVFSMAVIRDRHNDAHAWEVVAYHGESSLPQWVATMRVGPVESEATRRMRGARLVVALGNYLERQQADTVSQQRGGALHVMRMESNITWLPQVAARSVLQEI